MESIQDLFKEWCIPPDITSAFIENGITIELLPKLSPENYKELCPHLGTRLLLQEKVTDLIISCAQTESVTTTTEKELNSSLININLDEISISQLIPATISETKTVSNCFPNFDLETLLQTTPGGNSILKFYETYGHLNNNKRNQLTDLMIKHIYTHIVKCRITYEDYNILAAKIISLFPKESLGTYFTRPIKKRDSINGRSTIARGKLVDKVRNLIYKYGDRKRGHNTDSENVEDTPSKKQCLSVQANDDVIWLKQNSEPWEEVLVKWRNTFQFRKQSNLNNIHDFISEWNIICDARSDSLINTDFDLLYPNKGQNFYLNWDTFFANLVQLKSTKDEAIIEMIEKLANISDDDARLPAQIDVLGRLVPPRGRLSKNIKFTTQEAIQSVFVIAKSAGDIDAIIVDQKEKARTKKIPVQPYIILQGSLLSCSSPLLIIDDVRYYFRSIRKAFDILFKAYHVLNARYPRAGDYLYLIIQRCVYKVETKYDNLVSYISDILKMCE